MKKLFLIVVLTSIVLFYTGCFKNSTTNQTKIYSGQDATIKKADIIREQTKVDRIEVYDNYTSDYAKKLVKDNRIKKVIIVTTATNILMGLKIQNNVNADEILDIKSNIQVDISNNFGNSKDLTIVTSDDLFERMEKLALDIKQKKPITGFFEEIGAIVRKVIPVI